MAKRWEKRHFYICKWPGKTRELAPNEFVFPEHPLDIYGYEDDSEFEADHERIDDALEQGFIFGKWFSIYCPEGEYGEQHASMLFEITPEQFEAAQERGWK